MSIKKKTSKFVPVFLSLSTAVWLSGAAAMFVPISAGAITIDELKAQIMQLQEQLQQLTGQSNTVQGLSFTRNLQFGDKGEVVEQLQTALASDEEVYPEGLVTGYFGPLTKKAVIRFQEKYEDEILAPLGLTRGTGYVGNATREKLNELYGGGGEEVACADDIDNDNDGKTDYPNDPGCSSDTDTSETDPSVPGKAACEDGIDNDSDGKIDYSTDPGCSSTSDTDENDSTPPPAQTGTLKVEAGVQPAPYLFPTSSVRVPFTVVKFTAPADKDITVNSVTVERTGPAADGAFSGVVLLDENGNQVGLSKTLNSVHQVVLNEPFTVMRGTTKTMSLAGNAQTSNGSRGGQIGYLTLVSVDAGTGVTIDGTMPITGSGHTVIETLTIGSVTMARGPLDPNRSDGTSASKEIGVTGITFTSVKVTAGSAEKVYLKSIRWNQSGSASKGDLENVKTYVDGTAYDTIVSSDGKYYTTNFPGNGLLMDKGASLEAYVKGDIIGGSGRTVDFDIYRTTDMGLVGENFKFGINPPTTGTSDPTDDSSNFSTGNPWFDASQITVSNGTINVSKATSVAAQNIGYNLANQPLGGFEVEVKGEPIQVSSSIFHFQITSTAGQVEDITNITLVDENGAIVGGPVDGSGATTFGTATFSDTITFPIGKHTYTLKGKLGTDFSNNQTIVASTTPSSDWTSTGQTTGNSITETPSSAVSGNTMTVKTGALTISVSSVPLAQTVIAGASQFLFANYVLDAGNSGEDITMSSIPLANDSPGNTNVTTLTNCQLYDGTPSITTGSNVVNPSADSSSTSFTFDTALTIPKATVKTLGLKCNVAGNATANDQYMWGYDSGASPSASGKISGQSATITENDAVGQIMTVAASGGYSVANDSTPGYSIVSAGTTGVTLLRLKFSATTEDVNLQKVALELGGVSASNSAIDLVGRMVTLYDSANPSVAIGTAQFGAAGSATARNATSTTITGFTIPSGNSRYMLVKGDISAINNNSGPLTASGDLLRLSYDGNANGVNNGNYGVGANSGANISPTSADITSTGVRIMKSYPTITKVDLSSSEKVLIAGSARTLYKFSVKANNGDVYLYKLTFKLGSSTESATTTVYETYAYTDSGYSSVDSTFSTSGLLNAGSCYNVKGDTNFNAPQHIVEIYMDATGCNTATTTYKIPSGETRYFVFKATVSSVNAGGNTSPETITAQLEGDAAYPALGTLMANASDADGDGNDDLIWSPNSTSTSQAITDIDFTNGYNVAGLPTTNLASEVLTSTN